MLKNTKPILLFILVFSLALLLGNTQVGAGNRSLQKATSENVEATLEGDTMEDACIRVDQDTCVPMIQTVNEYACDGDVTLPLPTTPDTPPTATGGCVKIITRTLYFGDGSQDAGGGDNNFYCNACSLILYGTCFHYPSCP